MTIFSQTFSQKPLHFWYILWYRTRRHSRQHFPLSEVLFFSSLYFVYKCLWSVYADGIVRLQPRCSKVRLYSPQESGQRAVDQQCCAGNLLTIKIAENKMAFWREQKDWIKMVIFTAVVFYMPAFLDGMFYRACAGTTKHSVCHGNGMDYSL